MGDIGFSTGALGLGNLERALTAIRGDADIAAIEFSALRWNELESVTRRMLGMDLSQFRYVSFHAPSSFGPEQEPELVRFLSESIPHSVLIVVHPDSIHRVEEWRQLGARVALENMDKRKGAGRSVEELKEFFARLPLARFCLDVGHARQWDPSMTEAYRLLREFRDRLVEVHVSEVTADSSHGRLSAAAIIAFQMVAAMVPGGVPFIIEACIAADAMRAEIDGVRRAFAIAEQA